VNGRAFAPGARLALEQLGYRVVWASTQGHFDDVSWPASARIVDERHLERLPDPDKDPDTPIIALCGSRRRPYHDRRIAGWVQRPAELAALYGVLQSALESHPRRAPRVQTRLSARLGCDDRRWSGNVLTISEHGCLFEADDTIPSGPGLNLQLALPAGETLAVRARTLYSDGSRERAALAFEETPAAARERIASYVSTRLATL
jgi:hypothetical protein